jgi:hypothetical protein
MKVVRLFVSIVWGTAFQLLIALIYGVPSI